jgi:hypothetical protein
MLTTSVCHHSAIVRQLRDSQGLKVRSHCLRMLHVRHAERSEDQGDSDIRKESRHEVVTEKHDFDQDNDGYQRKHVQNDDCLVPQCTDPYDGRQCVEVPPELTFRQG